MAHYTPLDTVHSPIPGTSPPASWGLAIHGNMEYFRNPPGCVVRRTAAQAIPSGAITSVQFTAADLRDTDGYHSNISSPEKIIVPPGLGGWYDWYYNVRWASSSVGSRNAYLLVGSTVHTLAVEIHGNSANNYPQLHSGKIFLDAGTEVELQVYQGIGNPLNLTAAEFGLFLVASA